MWGRTRSSTRARVGALVVAALVAVTVGFAVDGATSSDVPRCERFAAQSAAREAVVTGSGPAVVVIGDSFSVGLGLDDPAHSWPTQLPGRVHVHGFSGSGFGLASGRCAGVSFWARAARAVRDEPELVVVQGGLNDVRTTEAELRTGVRRLLDRLHGRQVVLVGPPAAPSRAGRAAWVDGVLSDAAERAGVGYVSTYAWKLDYLEDALHLTRAGHREFGVAVARALRPR